MQTFLEALFICNDEPIGFPIFVEPVRFSNQSKAGYCSLYLGQQFVEQRFDENRETDWLQWELQRRYDISP